MSLVGFGITRQPQVWNRRWWSSARCILVGLTAWHLTQSSLRLCYSSDLLESKSVQATQWCSRSVEMETVCSPSGDRSQLSFSCWPVFVSPGNVKSSQGNCPKGLRNITAFPLILGRTWFWHSFHLAFLPSIQQLFIEPIAQQLFIEPYYVYLSPDLVLSGVRNIHQSIS